MAGLRGALEAIARDARYAVRALSRTPAFTAAALVTLALGIGATAAIFSVVNAALLKPPPYPEPDRILALTYPGGGAQTGEIFHDVRERLRSFQTIRRTSSSARCHCRDRPRSHGRSRRCSSSARWRGFVKYQGFLSRRSAATCRWRQGSISV